MFNYTALQPSLRLESQMVRGNSTFIAYLILNSLHNDFWHIFHSLEMLINQPSNIKIENRTFLNSSRPIWELRLPNELSICVLLTRSQGKAPPRIQQQPFRQKLIKIQVLEEQKGLRYSETSICKYFDRCCRVTVVEQIWRRERLNTAASAWLSSLTFEENWQNLTDFDRLWQTLTDCASVQPNSIPRRDSWHLWPFTSRKSENSTQS